MNKTHQYLKYRYRSSIYILIQQGAPLASTKLYIWLTIYIYFTSTLLGIWNTWIIVVPVLIFSHYYMNWSFQPYSLDQSLKLHLLSNLKFLRFLTPSFPNHESDTSNMQMIISQASQKFRWDKEKLQIHIHGVSTITDIHLFNRYIS